MVGKFESDSSLADELSIDAKLNARSPILEGTLLKRSSHHYWNDRYFVFSANNTLSYFHKKGTSRPRRSFIISREAGCEVSSLYVSQRPSTTGKKEMIYCFKLSWTSPGALSGHSTANMHDSGFTRDDSSAGLGLERANSGDVLEEDVEYLFESCDQPGPAGGFSTPIVSATPSFDKNERPEGENSSDSGIVDIRHSNSNDRLNAFNNSMSNFSAVSTTKKKKKKKSIWKSVSTRVTSNSSKKPRKSEKDERMAELDNEISLSGADNMESSMRRMERVQRMYAEQKLKERDSLEQQYISKKKATKKKQQKLILEGTKYAGAAAAAAGVAVLTAGAGLVAGLAVVGIGAAAGAGGSASALTFSGKKRSEIVLATTSYEDAKLWKSTFDAHLEYENLKETTWGRILFSEGQAKNPFLSLETDGSRDMDDRVLASGGEKTFLFEPTTQWRPLEGWAVSLLGTGNHGLRIFREEKSVSEPELLPTKHKRPVQRILTNLSVDGGTCSPMKAHVVLHTSPLNAFMCIMSYARMVHNGPDTSFCPRSEQATSFRVIESIDDHMDVVHVVFRALYLFPSWTCPRDFVLVRYWRYEPDGSFVICYESVQHRDCPPIDGYVRGEMHQAYTVSPRKHEQTREGGAKFDSQIQECLLTAVVQVDPRGWVPISPLPFVSMKCYGDCFGIAALHQLLDIRDAIDRDRFVAAALDIEPPTNHFHAKAYDLSGADEPEKLEVSTSNDNNRNYDFAYSCRESNKAKEDLSGLLSAPPPFYVDKWAEPDSNSFLVRGPAYLRDQVKINAGQSIGRLIAVDIVEVDAPIYSGMAKHPTERIQMALKKEKFMRAQGLKCDVPPFIWLLNIVLPGEPLYHMVLYYAIDDISEVDGSSGTPTSKLCNEFFFGNSDEFRDRTFKLIPQIVQGNFMVRKAVGSTPAIMGKKLRQLYVKDEEENRFFEIILDCCSSSVAAGVIRLSLGYAKTLVVDLGFLFEGHDETVLPERIFGCVRIKNADFSMPVRKVLPP